MLDRVFTELRQGHRLEWLQHGLRVVNAKGEVKHTIARDPLNRDYVSRAIELLLRERKTWLEGFYAASDKIEEDYSREVAVA